MRGFLLAILLGCLLIGGVFSLRPGGLRVQLRLIRRRFKVAMIVAGIFMVLSFLVRILAPSVWISDAIVIALGLAAAVAFLVWAQDPPLEAGQPRSRVRR
ncbi:MAG: hypothetical protein ACREQM_16935 [Candidatus Dormibacteraceae bacterium]